MNKLIKFYFFLGLAYITAFLEGIEALFTAKTEPKLANKLLNKAYEYIGQ